MDKQKQLLEEYKIGLWTIDEVRTKIEELETRSISASTSSKAHLDTEAEESSDADPISGNEDGSEMEF